MTRTITSNAPGSGTSISSSWNASEGCPSRSCRITQAAIVSGSVPGSTSRLVTFFTSIAIAVQVLLRDCRTGEIRPQSAGGTSRAGSLRAERLRDGLGVDLFGRAPPCGRAAALDEDGCGDDADSHDGQ